MVQKILTYYTLGQAPYLYLGPTNWKQGIQVVEGIQVTQAALAVQAVQAVEEDAVAVVVESNKAMILFYF